MTAGGRLIHILTRPLAALPLGFHRACGRAFGRFLGRTVRYRRDVVIANLSRSFPEKKYDELSSICDRFYEHLATVFCEAIWFGGQSAEKLKASGIVRMTNPEVLNGYASEGRSVCVMAAHNGNWELYGGYLCYSPDIPLKLREKDVVVVFKKQTSGAWDSFMGWNRRAPLDDREHFEGMVETRSVMRHAVTHRHEFKIYNFITDQYPYSPRGIVEDVSFMHQTARAMTGAAAVAHAAGMAVLYLNMAVTDEGNYTMTYTEICPDASQEAPETIVRRFYALLEKDLEKQPFNYLWTHKRWK